MMTRFTAAAGVATLFAAPATAQVVPPAQVLRDNPMANPDRINEAQRQRLQERAAPEAPPRNASDVEAPRPAEPTLGDQTAVRFTLVAITFDLSSYLTSAELDALAKPLIGKEVILGDLQRLVDAINILYAQRGLTTAQAALPAQQIDGGNIHIRLIEGRVGTIAVEGGSAGSRAYAQRAAPRENSLARPAALEQQLRLFNLNNDAQLRARLAPGTTFGNTDVTLTVAEPPRISGDVFVDNNGFESTGAQEVGAVVRIYRLFSDEDRLSAVMVRSRGVGSANVSLSAPVDDRFRIGVSGSYGSTHVLFGQIASLGVRGTSLSFGGDAAALLSFDDRSTVTATLGVQSSLSRTSIGGRRVIENASINGSAGMAATYAVPGLSISSQGQLTLAKVRERLSGAETAPVLFQGSTQIAKSVVPNVQARVRGDWQLSTKRNLPGMLQYQIGGARSLRAYAPGIAAGDNGLSLSGELAFAASYKQLAVEPFAFVDFAHTDVVGQATNAGAAGLGIALIGSRWINVRGTVATDIGHGVSLKGSSRSYVSATAHF